MKKIIFGLTILMLTSVMSCSPKYIKIMKELKLENPEKQADKDRNMILDYLIANEILIKLFSDYSKPKFYSVDLCGNFTIQKKYKKFILKPNNYHRYWSKEHIRWLEGFISIYPSKYYQFFLNTFKQKTIKKINNCSIKLN